MTTRRQFLSTTAAAAGAAAPGIARAEASPAKGNFHPRSLAPEFVRDASGRLAVNPAQQVSYTACMGCTTMCPVRVRLDRSSGKVLRVAGNPYSPLSTANPIPYASSVRDSYAALARDAKDGVVAAACGRGNAVLEQLDSPYRVLTPLKRVGPRNGGQWQPIPFEQLVREIVEGGDLFGEGPVEGLRALRDLATPIDPAQPQLGPRVNQVALLSSFNDGREAFARRFMQSSFGTINFVGHGSYCGGSYRSGSGAMFGDMKGMPHAKPDFANAEFVLFVGTAPGHAGNPFKRQAQALAQARRDGRLSYVVVDPVLTHAASAAAGERSRWVPIRPGTDGALAMGMMRWMFAAGRVDERYLAQPSPKAAENAGEASWSNASHLVIVEPGHAREGLFLRASDLGRAVAAADRYGDKDAFVAIDPATGFATPHVEMTGPADPWYDGAVELGGKRVAVRTSLALLRAEAMRRTLDEYADACGIPSGTIAELAREFTAHGKKASVNVHGGTMAGNGFYNAYALVMLNTLVGNLNVRGGTLVNGGGFPDAGPGPRYDLATFPGAVKVSGTPVGRNVPYERSAEFGRRKAQGQPYPAQAPWFPNAPQLATEWLTAPLDGYPYPLKALVLWSSNPVYGIPGLRERADRVLGDPAKLPLIVAIDPFINESSAFADYIVPDSMLYESWGYGAAWAGVPTKATTARWPVVTPKAAKLADGTPIGMESLFIALAKAMKLPGFGPHAIADADGRRHPLERPEDWYLRGGANVAFAGKAPVPEAGDEDLLLSGLAKLQPLLAATLKADEWRRVAYVLARGGRYQPAGETFRPDKPALATNAFGRPMQVYNETLAASRSSITGKRFAGTPAWAPPVFADGTPVRDRYPQGDWPLSLVSFKSALHNSYSLGAERLRRLHPEPEVRMHEDDAKRLGIADGDAITITTPGGQARAKVEVGRGVARGTIAVEHGFGHRELGARAHVVGGKRQPEAPALAAGLNLNDLGLVDPTRHGPSVWTDPVAGSSVRNGLPARVAKA